MERMGVGGTMIGLNTAIGGHRQHLDGAVRCRAWRAVSVSARLLTPVSDGGIGARGLQADSTTCVAWFPLRFVFATALGVLFVLSEYWINAAAPSARRGLVMGIYASVLAVGFALGPIVLTLSGTEGWTPYLVGGALFVAGGAPLMLARNQMPTIEHGETKPVLPFLFAAPAATGAALAFGALETGGFSLLPVWGLRLGQDASDAALLVTLFAGGSLLFQIPMGMLSDRMDRRNLLLLVGLLGAAGALLLPLAAANALLLGALLVVWGGLVTSLYTVGLAHLGARFAGSDLASANAAFFMIYNVGLVIGPPAIGFGMERVSPPDGFAYAMAAFAEAMPAS